MPPTVGDGAREAAAPPLLVDRHRRPGLTPARASALGALDYEALLAEGDPDFAWRPPADEWQAIALNYTSGTTGNPKGVVYHHRGAYLNAIGNVLAWGMPRAPGLPVDAADVPLQRLVLPVDAWRRSPARSVCLRRVDAAGDLRG